MVDFNSTQPSFSSGIISTELFSRIDYSKLLSGVKQCENWEIRPAGGAAYRPGTKHIAQTKTGTGEVYLMPFNQARDNGYCLEFGAGYIRFYKDGQQIMSGGNPVEVSTTYTQSELADIKYAQNKNQMFIVHQNHCPAILTRNSDTSWSLVNMVFNPSVPQVASVTITAQSAKEPSEVVTYDKWQYAVSVVKADGNEGMATKSAVISSDIDLTNQNIKVDFTAPSGMSAGDYFYVYRIYRGEFYFIYKMEYRAGTSNYSLLDLSFAVDTTKSIKERFASFDNNNYPAAVGFWNQRLVFANTPNGPNTLYASNVGVYDDFTTTILNNSDEAFELTLSSGTTDIITDIVAMDDMIAMTQGKIWRIVGTSAANMSAYIESYSGASGLRPFAYKKSILYVDSSKNTVSNFIYSYELNGYTGQNLDILCRDLFDGHTLTDITFRDTPFGVLYVVRNDGVLLAMTYLKEENIWAWHKHTTNGKFKAICCVDKSIDDDIYVVVERNGIQYVELFQQQIDVQEDIDDSWHLDAATRHVETTKMYAWENDAEKLVYTLSETPSAGATVYSDRSQTVLSTVTSYSSGMIVVDGVTYARCVDGDGLKTVSTMSGLSRFNGQEISVMADGNEYKNVEVTNGSITLDVPSSNILAGLPYDGYLEPIPVDIKFQTTGSTVGLNRRINKATIRYYRSRGLWYGTSIDHLFQIKPYTNDSFGYDIPLETNVLNTEITDTYKTESSFIISQKSPFPALVQSITLGISYGEKN